MPGIRRRAEFRKERTSVPAKQADRSRGRNREQRGDENPRGRSKSGRDQGRDQSKGPRRGSNNRGGRRGGNDNRRLVADFRA